MLENLNSIRIPVLKKNKNYLATWICIDSLADASWFPAAKGDSSDLKIQANYWRCLAVCLFSARLYNPDVKLLLFSNQDVIPMIDDISIKQLLDGLNVQFITTAFEYRTPIGYYSHWRNQFYEFSIFNYIVNSSIFNDTDTFVLVDSDCVVTSDLSNMFSDLQTFDCINYQLDYAPNYKINGNSRQDMQAIFGKLLNSEIGELPNYYAGEFFGGKISALKSIVLEFKEIWPLLLDLHQSEKPHLHEEAHVLSYIYFKLGFGNDVAGRYIKRLWTDPSSLRNVDNGDEKKAVWHLPAQKRSGFKKMFTWLVKHEFDHNRISKEQFLDFAKRYFEVPKISIGGKVFYFLKGCAKILIKKK